MPRQLIPPFEALYDILGTQPASGGSIQTYDIGTTTPKTTYGDYDQTSANTNPVLLDSAGRVATPVWGDGEYTLVLRNADGEVIKTWESRPEQPSTTTLPTLNSGEFLTGDGLNYLAELIRQVPDPTGSSGYLLSNDGANSMWISAAAALAGLIPEAPTLDIVVGASSLRIGDGVSSTKVLIQTGTGSATVSGQHFVSTSVTIPTAYTSIWYAGVTCTSSAVSSGETGKLPAVSASGWTAGNSASSFVVNFATTEDDRSPTNQMTINPEFAWLTIGTVTV